MGSRPWKKNAVDPTVAGDALTEDAVVRRTKNAQNQPGSVAKSKKRADSADRQG